MRAAAWVAALALLAAPATAQAADATRGEVAVAAERAAAGDAEALAELRGLTTVDGAPVDIDAALAGAQGEDLAERLRELARAAAAEPEAGLPDAEDAREQAAEIVPAETSPPAVAEHGGDGTGFGLPLGPAVALAVLLIALGLYLARRAAARRVLEARAAGSEPAPEPAPPRELEREADAAERRGDYAAAVRLRFLAGLERLSRRGRLRLHPALTAPGAARELRSPALAALARAYDEIVFGSRVASAGDAEAARSGWSRVLREADA